MREAAVADVAAPAGGRSWRPVVAFLAAVAAGALGVIGYEILVDDHGQLRAEAAAQIAVAWTFVGAGLIGAWRRPRSRVGPLLAAAGVALLLRRLQYSDTAALFTIGFALGEVSNALIAHAVLGYPSGRLGSRIERVVIGLGYGLTLALPIATLLFYDPAGSCLFDCPSQGPESLISVTDAPGAVDVLRAGYKILVFGGLGLAFIALVARKLIRASPAGRRLLAPMLVAGVLAGIRGLLEAALTFTDYSEATRQALFWWQIAVQITLPLALLFGLLRSRLAYAAFADSLPGLDGTPPGEIRGVMARALGDPSLELAFWLPERSDWVDEGGAPVRLPEDDETRMVTHLLEHGKPVAALVHDPALDENRSLVQAAGTAARLALENARLHAELQAQLVAVRESRARIVAAGDVERRRIERDLHDGAQQRLLAVALNLAAAEHRHANAIDPALKGALLSAVEELQGAVNDLRELVYGLHPTILAEQGLDAALRALAARSPIPVSVHNEVGGRLEPDVEATAYFVACEALANVAKHAGASACSVHVALPDGRVAVEVTDDGAGGADVDGLGLRGLADRVEARGGRLVVASPPGGGTILRGEFPCES